MAQMAEQARAIVAAGKVEVLEDAAADLSTRPAVEPELAKACVIAAGYLAAASVNAEGADNLPANSDDDRCWLSCCCQRECGRCRQLAS